MNEMSTELYADGATIEQMHYLRQNAVFYQHGREVWVKGFTTNPSLMRKLGVTDYRYFVNQALDAVVGAPISFEVVADELEEMEKQARILASWENSSSDITNNIFVKVPIINTKGESTLDVISRLALSGIKVNVTAVFTPQQLEDLALRLVNCKTPTVISIFAGRIADTCVNPRDLFSFYHSSISPYISNFNLQSLWASTRQIYDYRLATQYGADIITMPVDMITKMSKTFYKDLNEFCKETVQMFYDDAVASGYKIEE